MIKDGKEYISKSGFNLFKNCSLKYKLRYVDKIKGKVSPYKEVADFGNMIHSNIENIKDNIIMKTDSVIVPIKSYVRNKKLNINNKNYNLDETKHMNNFLKFTNILFKKSGNIKYSIPIETEGHYFNDELRTHGFIDAVYNHYKDDGIILVDWKTGKQKSDDECRDEMLFYALCWNAEHIEKVKYISMIFTKNGHIFMEPVTEEGLQTISKEILEVHSMIESELFFKTMENWRCKYCEYKDNGCKGK